MISSSAAIFNLRDGFFKIPDSGVKCEFLLPAFAVHFSSPQTPTVNEIIAPLIEIVNYRSMPITASVINYSHMLWKLEKFTSV